MKNILCLLLVLPLVFNCGTDSLSEENNQNKVLEKTICECYKWGEDLTNREIAALEGWREGTGSTDEVKKAEDERKEWNLTCLNKMSPTETSEQMKLIDEIKKCQ